MEFHNALTGTITITEDPRLRPARGFRKFGPKSGRRTQKSKARPHEILVPNDVLDNCVVLDADQHEELTPDDLVVLPAEITGPTAEVREAIVGPVRIQATSEFGRVQALLDRVKIDAITRQEFFAALPTRVRRTMDQQCLLNMYNEAS